MIQYPMTFLSKAQSASGIQTKWQGQALSQDNTLTLAIPPEFEGPGGGYSPEDLFVLALQNCFIATFKVFAEKSRLAFEAVQVDAALTVDRDSAGRPWMAKCHLKVQLKGCSQSETALRILTRTSESCMILNSVKTEKTFDFEVQTEK